ncbi:MAG TPA: hypothetical protein VGJ20_21830 [Xanthobacteraceae bacterium]|jgi:hypothetical protein
MRVTLQGFRLLANAAALSVLTLVGCTTNPPTTAEAPSGPPAAPAIPSSYRPEEFIGRWGYGAYHNDPDLQRTAAAARAQCGQPVVINRGPNGGLMMYLADSAELQDLRLKGSQSGKNYIGPPGDPGGSQDREIVSFDGRTLVLKWMDPEVAGRYGTGVYVRCAPEGTAHARPRKTTAAVAAPASPAAPPPAPQQ